MDSFTLGGLKRVALASVVVAAISACTDPVAAQDAVRAPDQATSARAAELDARMAELGLSGGMAHPYYVARECGADEQALAAFRERARKQVEQLVKSEAAAFDQNFEAAIDVVAERMALHDSFPGEQKWNTPEGCQWALDTVQR